MSWISALKYDDQLKGLCVHVSIFAYLLKDSKDAQPGQKLLVSPSLLTTVRENLRGL